MAKYNVKSGNTYKKRDCYCRRPGCHNPPAEGLKYCLDCLAIERARSLTERANRRIEVMTFLGGVVCAVPNCGVCDPLMLEIDHVHNDGSVDKHTVHPVTFVRILVRLCREHPEQARDRFQVLCSGHNKQKEIFRARGWEWSLSIASQRLKEYHLVTSSD